MTAEPFLLEAESLISSFATTVSAIARREYQMFGRFKEHQPPLAQQIRRYWTELGFNFPGVTTPWSAVFVSWCVKRAGATANEFRFAPQHSVFVYHAIRNALAQTGVFRAYPVTHYAPQVGDIIHNNRGGNAYTYDFASRNLYYSSHTAIVVGRGADASGSYVVTVGGNESNSVGTRRVRVNASGLVIQRQANPFICVIRTLK